MLKCGSLALATIASVASLSISPLSVAGSEEIISQDKHSDLSYCQVLDVAEDPESGTFSRTAWPPGKYIWEMCGALWTLNETGVMSFIPSQEDAEAADWYHERRNGK